jgi:hypothetical protein
VWFAPEESIGGSESLRALAIRDVKPSIKAKAIWVLWTPHGIDEAPYYQTLCCLTTHDEVER